MPLLDERGRLFGKVNLIDAAVGILIVVLIPIGYLAYGLFRTPAPTISAVEPSTLVQADGLTVKVRGQNLLPFLRVFAGSQAASFYIQSPELGEVKLPDHLEPGTYDLSFFNESQLVAKMPAALQVIPPPPPVQPVSTAKPAETLTVMMRVPGTFVGLTRENLRQLTPGYRFKLPDDVFVQLQSTSAPDSDVIRLAPSDQTPFTIPHEGKFRMNGVLRLRCTIVGPQCRVGSEAMHPGLFWSLPVPNGEVTFVEGDLTPDVEAKPAPPTVADVRVRFVVPAEVFGLIARGDYSQLWQATLTAIDGVQDTTTEVSLNQLNGRGNIQGTVAVQQQLKSFVGTVRLTVRNDGSSWVPQNPPATLPPDGLPSLKAGSILTFDTSDYTMRGWIIGVKTGQAPPARATP